MGYRFVYFDTETTGLKPDKERIIELAFYDPVKNLEKSWFINPQMPIPAQATAVHNITDEMVKDAPTFPIVAKEMVEFLEGDVALVAHNGIGFDKPFIEAEFKRAEVELPEYIYVDTLHWARKYRPDLPRHTLQYLREIYGVEANNAHRALDDVLVLEKVFSKMIDDLSPERVIDLLKKRDLKTMPFGKHQGKELCDVPKGYIQWLHKSGAFEREENKSLLEEFTKLNLL